MIDIEKMRENFADTNRGKTHYEGCEYVHPLCAIAKLCDELEQAHRHVEDLRSALAHRWECQQILERTLQKQRERNYLALRTLHEDYDEGSSQSMALAMAILEGDRNAIEDAKRDRQKQEGRLFQKTGGMPDPYYETQPGSPNFEGGAAWERYMDEESGWLPAPNTMPEELAPAQMVEVRRPGGGQAFAKMIAVEVNWSRWSDYRLLYSDSGLPLCSAEGLEEWARFVATDKYRMTYQYDHRPYLSHDKIEWCPSKNGIGLVADSPHHKPGDWRFSLMEVMR